MSEPSQGTATDANQATKQPLALPAPADDDDIARIEVNGQSYSLFDRLGPTVVNSDGTLSRISDWSERTPAERANILRVLGKRNQLRLAATKERLGAEGDEAVKPAD
ncbi:fungal specific transcription factor [Rhodotorula toruloides]|uniref:Fungal specific transcription factor n=1 Tax=Rhodotorula toruloides TaxID=5286 RepID=A0A511KQ21_RHOTO|nr:fungal specific transcription factor [Rhodotorula toruloides]